MLLGPTLGLSGRSDRVAQPGTWGALVAQLETWLFGACLAWLVSCLGLLGSGHRLGVCGLS